LTSAWFAKRAVAVEVFLFGKKMVPVGGKKLISKRGGIYAWGGERKLFVGGVQLKTFRRFPRTQWAQREGE